MATIKKQNIMKDELMKLSLWSDGIKRYLAYLLLFALFIVFTSAKASLKYKDSIVGLRDPNTNSVINQINNLKAD